MRLINDKLRAQGIETYTVNNGVIMYHFSVRSNLFSSNRSINFAKTFDKLDIYGLSR